MPAKNRRWGRVLTGDDRVVGLSVVFGMLLPEMAVDFSFVYQFMMRPFFDQFAIFQDQNLIRVLSQCAMIRMISSEILPT